jgi:hypothetical protein
VQWQQKTLEEAESHLYVKRVGNCEFEMLEPDGSSGACWVPSTGNPVGSINANTIRC